MVKKSCEIGETLTASWAVLDKVGFCWQPTAQTTSNAQLPGRTSEASNYACFLSIGQIFCDVAAMPRDLRVHPATRWSTCRNSSASQRSATCRSQRHEESRFDRIRCDHMCA